MFIDELSRVYADDFLLVVMDQAGSHLSATIVWPAHIQPLCLPPYSPELNPVERWFEALRAVLSNQLFTRSSFITPLTASSGRYVNVLFV